MVKWKRPLTSRSKFLDWDMFWRPFAHQWFLVLAASRLKKARYISTGNRNVAYNQPLLLTGAHHRRF